MENNRKNPSKDFEFPVGIQGDPNAPMYSDDSLDKLVLLIDDLPRRPGFNPENFGIPPKSRLARSSPDVEINTGAVITVPDQSPTIQTILERATRGIMPTGNKNPVFNPNFRVNPAKLDLTEMDDIRRATDELVKDTAKKIGNKKREETAGLARKTELKEAADTLADALLEKKVFKEGSRSPEGVKGD